MATGTEDPYAVDAGAYVLGALAPAERADFEEHLTGCASCRAAVEELAGLPGLLAHAPAAAVAALADDAPPEPPLAPRTLLPRLLRAARAHRRRRRLALSAGAAAACLAAAAGAVALLPEPAAPPAATPVPAGPSAPAAPSEEAGQRMQELVPVPLTATVQLTEEAWGTQVDLVCAYAADDAGHARPYALVVADTDGNAQRIGTWTAQPGRDARLSGATALTLERIAAVEVQTLQGTAVLRTR
ncbi:zf-HC2 domain-containing protein [Paenibacillus sp. TRM 82003]|uniref:zf-HC2 domain-containing protein n=1 Tax=Kineococcus sp. TRM81007 TaxID=2925831 RepID=UPI001F56AD85|nr:zf-HC2 domain-containing protein [Kineococcus sp. TRM81007]MCI2237669.1 zf-HC2 domain-containing protein [Kineococcus sp. TRM81007]MCI3921686.1 zf-HC2 domain-containing protein [Paenibacillus sp. TRM 82003]